MSNDNLNDESNNCNETTTENQIVKCHDTDDSSVGPPKTNEINEDITANLPSLLPQLRLKTSNWTSPVRKRTESTEIITAAEDITASHPSLSPQLRLKTNNFASPVRKRTESTEIITTAEQNSPCWPKFKGSTDTRTEPKINAFDHVRRGITGIVSHLSCDVKRRNHAANNKSDGTKGTKYPVLWYCEQDPEHMLQYTADQILTGTNFVMYSLKASNEIEHAYQKFQHRQGPPTFSLDGTSYQFNFEHMFRMNIWTNHKRKIRRNTEQQILPPKSVEYEKIESYFLSSIGIRKSISIVKIERINNPTLLDTYEAKLKSMTRRYSENPNYCINNNKNKNSYKENDTSTNKFERRWLFHGTKKEIVPKIVRQGFNRSFSNQRVSFGKGVYFARDANYSCNKKFAAKDEDGIQYVFLCRVAVGDWCLGSPTQVIPACKPYDDRDTFDSTVDNLFYPKIFVIYHDCQAYPEYLISFREN